LVGHDACVVEQDVNSAERFAGLGNGLADLLLVAEVSDDGLSLATVCVHRPDRLLGGLSNYIHNGDASPSSGEHHAAGTPEGASGASDDGPLVDQPAHRPPSSSKP
jgi:hypothetical protein